MSMRLLLSALSVAMLLTGACVGAEPATAAKKADTEVPGAFRKTFKLPPEEGQKEGQRLFAVGKDSITIWRPHEMILFVDARRQTRIEIEEVSYRLVSVETLPAVGDAGGGCWRLRCRSASNLLVDLTYAMKPDGTGTLSYRGPNGPTVLSGRTDLPQPKPQAGKKKK
jgi:hypothetical protein